MPRYIPMRGLVGHTLVYESELGIVVDESALASQDKTFATLFFSVGYCLLKQLACIPMLAVCGQRIYAKNHLPRTAFVVHGGVLVHLIGQVRVIGHESVHERNEVVAIVQQPEMIPNMGNSLGKFGSGSGSAGGKHSAQWQIMREHHRARRIESSYYTSQGFSKIVGIQESFSMILCITRLSNTVAEHIAFELGLLETIDPTCKPL